jgi:hypothetical protein
MRPQPRLKVLPTPSHASLIHTTTLHQPRACAEIELDDKRTLLLAVTLRGLDDCCDLFAASKFPSLIAMFFAVQVTFSFRYDQNSQYDDRRGVSNDNSRYFILLQSHLLVVARERERERVRVKPAMVWLRAGPFTLMNCALCHTCELFAPSVGARSGMSSCATRPRAKSKLFTSRSLAKRTQVCAVDSVSASLFSVYVCIQCLRGVFSVCA